MNNHRPKHLLSACYIPDIWYILYAFRMQCEIKQKKKFLFILKFIFWQGVKVYEILFIYLFTSLLKVDYMCYAAAAAKSFQSCPTLCDPIDGSPPGTPVPGILQARTLEWVAISFSNVVCQKLLSSMVKKEKIYILNIPVQKGQALLL